MSEKVSFFQFEFKLIQKALNERLFCGIREMVLVVLFVNALVIKKNYLLQLGKKIANQVQHAMEVERKGNETQKGKLPNSAKLGRLFANTSLRKKIVICCCMILNSGNFCSTGLSFFRLRLRFCIISFRSDLILTFHCTM